MTAYTTSVMILENGNHVPSAHEEVIKRAFNTDYIEKVDSIKTVIEYLEVVFFHFLVILTPLTMEICNELSEWRNRTLLDSNVLYKYRKLETIWISGGIEPTVTPELLDMAGIITLESSTKLLFYLASRP